MCTFYSISIIQFSYEWVCVYAYIHFYCYFSVVFVLCFPPCLFRISFILSNFNSWNWLSPFQWHSHYEICVIFCVVTWSPRYIFLFPNALIWDDIFCVYFALPNNWNRMRSEWKGTLIWGICMIFYLSQISLLLLSLYRYDRCIHSISHYTLSLPLSLKK